MTVLDEVHEPRGRGAGPAFVRLLRVDPSGLSASELTRWARRTSSDRFALAADQTGNVWVASSPSRGRSHAVVEIERSMHDGSVRGAGRIIESGSGRIGAGDVLRVEPNGITVVLDDPSRGMVTRGYRFGSLRRDPHGAERCF